MLLQLFDIFKWYLVIQLLGVAGFILGYKIFPSLKMHGYAISKTSGLFIFSIITWFACNLKITLIPYSSFTLYIIAILIGVFTYYQFIKIKQEIVKFSSENRWYIFYIELAFLIFFLIFVLLRAYTPNIEGTEKPLEFVVINSILNTDYLPPFDAWLSGNTINYYYLGQFIFCNLIKLTFINPSTGFNLINPVVLALVIIGSFEFIYELTGKAIWGILSAFMTGLMGNLEPIVQILSKGWNIDTYRWWDTAHIIPNSFPEFPYWSFLHSDVHAHLLVHPFTVMFLFLMLAFIRDGNYLISLEDFRNKKKLALNTLYCLFIGSFMLINSWNYPSAIALTIAGLYIHCYLNLPKAPFPVNLARIISPSIFYILFSYILYLAFYAYYTSPIEGIGIVDSATRTTPEQFLMLLGTFLLPVCLYIIIDFINIILKTDTISLKYKIVLTLGFAGAIALSFFLTKSLVISIAFAICIYTGIQLISSTQSAEKSVILAIIFLTFSLILTCELIYINDLFTGDYERQNTVAKSYIQILLLLPIATSYIMYYISNKNLLKGTIKNIYIVAITMLIIFSSIFLIIGTYQKSNRFERVYGEENWDTPTLNGSHYIKVKYDGEYDGILWLKEHANKNDVILETEGAPYSHYGRVSSQTGIPSLINWGGSLSVLRGKYFYLISNPKYESIKKIYQSTNKKAVYPLIKEHKITYIFVGPLERVDYTPAELLDFDREKSLFTMVFHKGNTSIYKVK